MDKISWIDAKGYEFSFDVVLRGMKGRFMPPISFLEEKVPFQYGSRLRQTRIEPRDIDIPIYIEAESDMMLRKKVRETLSVLNPMIGDGKLRVVSPDGSQREIYCRYSTGIEGAEDRDTKGNTWMIVILVFRAFDPFWYDTTTHVQTFQTGEPATFFPFFPLRLTSSTVFADITIDNSGDVETWPEWIVAGPGTDIVLRNLTTGEMLHLQTSLGEGETITIDTKPGKKTIKKGDRTNLFATQKEGSSLWSLQAGKNNIRIEMSNANLRSYVQLSYKNRYWGP